MIDMSTDRESSHSGKHGYWNVFPAGKGEWYAKLNLKGVDHKPFLASVQSLSQKLNRSVFKNLRKQTAKSGVRPNRAKIRSCLKAETKRLIELTQCEDVTFSTTASALFQHRSGWYKDRLLTQIDHKMMRHIRNIRVGSSLLGSNFATTHPLPCKYCNVNETPRHFLLECSQFRVHRRKLLAPIRNILSDMGLEVTPEILLGFFPACATKRQEKNTRDIRKEILMRTLNYLEETRRFDTRQE